MVWPFGNHVDIDASSAKLGKRSASILPSGPSRSSAGNSSKTTSTTGGWRSADSAESSSPMPMQPLSSTAAASSAASQKNHRALIGDLEHLHGVAALAQSILRNHDRVALHALALQVEASPNGLDTAIHGDRQVPLTLVTGSMDPSRDLAGHDSAWVPHARERVRERDRGPQALARTRGDHLLPDQVAVRPEARVEARPVARPELAQPSPDERVAAGLPARRRNAHDRAEVPLREAHLTTSADG